MNTARALSALGLNQDPVQQLRTGSSSRALGSAAQLVHNVLAPNPLKDRAYVHYLG